MPKNKFYITTAIDYANAAPHLGHALEKVQADVLARYHRIAGDNVFFSTGTDEHGVKNARAAQVAGLSPAAFVDANAAVFQKLTAALNISNDIFLRTTDKRAHWPAVVKVWKKLSANGDIYKKEYEGLYCVGHEAFVTQKDLVEGKCALHQKEPELIREENYFFRLSRYAQAIESAITNDTFRVLPAHSKNEALQFLGEGLEDVSFSRPSKDLSWGIPVPGDASQTIYVWADALTNYLSAIGYGDKEDSEGSQFKTFWPADVHIIGKDILRFHALIWPGILLSVGLPLPKVLFAHGFISVGGEKMSKTIGNVIDPFVYIEQYGADALRYYLLREIPSSQDGDFTAEKFRERYEGDLANGLGNLLARVVTLGEKHIQKSFPGARSDALDEFLDVHWAGYHEALEAYRFDEALRIVWDILAYGDKMVDSSKLWELPETHPERFEEIIAQLAGLLATVAHMLRPFLPKSASRMFVQLGIDPESSDEWVFTMKKDAVIFPR